MEDETVRKRAGAERAEAGASTKDGWAVADARATAEAELAQWRDQLTRCDAIRQDAYRLRAADIVSRRFLIARLGAVLAVTLIASGVVLLALAPIGQA